MSFSSILLRLSPATPYLRPPLQPSDLPPSLSRVWSAKAANKQPCSRRLLTISNVVSKRFIEVLQDELQEIKWEEILDDEKEEEALRVSSLNEKTELIESARSMLKSMNDGEISSSAYDTAWVALVQDIHGSDAPQFPSSLQWIVDNQLSDGSWGDLVIFSAHDRIISTLACVVALKSWGLHPERCERGLSFIRENMEKIEDENAEHMPIGFEVAFPSLIELARGLDLDIPYDSPALQEIHARRNLKLTRIPRDLMHTVPTTLLYSLEGMPGLDWEKLLKLQCADGSFLFSPASTAFALMETKDEKCLAYLNKAVERFNGGVPNVHPIDLFEHVWAVDRLDRLGVSRYFKPEIKECANYIHRYWREEGFCWARNSPVRDIDDTAMAFRILRLNGHDVSADVFKHFMKGGKFFCFAGQSNQAVTGMFNLFRASQVALPGENILEAAKKFSFKFLREKQASNQLLDKWIIIKDLPGEVGYAFDVPWFASLPRIETRFYVEQYGGEDDVWIGKTLYRMPYVNNNVYLELAKMDFNECQALYQQEWVSHQKWYSELKLGELGVSRKTLLETYFLAAASIFEPERSTERLAWARSAVLVEAILSYFDKKAKSIQQRKEFIRDFNSSYSINNENGIERSSASKTTRKVLLGTLLSTVNHLSLAAVEAHGGDIRHHLRCAWHKWLVTVVGEEDDREDGEAELIVRIVNLCAGRSMSEEILSHLHYEVLCQLTNRVCHQLRRIQELKKSNGDDDVNTGDMPSLAVDSDMKELLRSVLQSSDGMDPEIKQTFLTVAKSYYYKAYCPQATVNLHIAKVLFESVV